MTHLMDDMTIYSRLSAWKRALMQFHWDTRFAYPAIQRLIADMDLELKRVEHDHSQGAALRRIRQLEDAISAWTWAKDVWNKTGTSEWLRRIRQAEVDLRALILQKESHGHSDPMPTVR